jgi:formylglycine-generating enzyme required for sulfatase activity
MRSIVFVPIVILMVVLQSGCNNQVNFLPDVPGDQPKVLTNSIDMKLVLIPKGKFMMGSPETEVKRNKNETQHEVTISQNFYMGSTEVTQAQWQKVMGNKPSFYKGDELPVEQISWQEAVDFCKQL